MGELVTAAIAQASPGNELLGMLPLMILFGVVFWFLTIRPQKKQADAHSTLLAALKKGDEVVLNSGIFCKIHSISDRTIMADLGNVRVRVLKSHVSALASSLNTGADVKSLETGSGAKVEPSDTEADKSAKADKKKKKKA
ncbi:MAG: preprotein translocase subunit YajC [Deltaproteobacteria bacterium]|nr:preprotein translocase subunit YajC [Deltaproteobacteria bacterium]